MNILCIDLKSFFASCECVVANLDPYKTPLVVANPHQGKGAITLAITPYLKNKGIKSRSRLYEIPPYIDYKIVSPKHYLYEKYSQKVIDVYLEFIAKEDLHVYSIDECFLDVTNYLKLYKKTDWELAAEILKTIYQKTGLTASCGIGPNMFIAKVAMDIDAKNIKKGIAKWTYEDVKSKLWPITSLNKVWGIGKKTENKLNSLGIFSMKDLANYDKLKLVQKFGVLGYDLWNHANGIDESNVRNENKMAIDKSYSRSKMFLVNYNELNIFPIILEMLDSLSEKLRNNNKEAQTIGFRIDYSFDFGGFFQKSITLEKPNDDMKVFFEICQHIFEQYYEYIPIRKISIHLSNLSDKLGKQLSLFDNIDNIIENDKFNQTIIDIKKKYGKEIIKKASFLIEDNSEKEK